ncbi:MAG: competence/damage-inducible protein A [Bacteroidales bacterium]|nr:competence/damage-inducible protein A [Bacteroidales bacterium]
MKTEIITIGDEILIGQIVDTNSAWMAEKLNNAGISVYQITTIADNREHILKTVQAALDRVDIVLVTGGLGPTSDDITKKTLAEFFHSSLVLNEEVLESVRQRLEERNIQLNDLIRGQALVPDKCQAFVNEWGTAPGMWFETNGKVLVSMPGVPVEMKGIMEKYVIPNLKLKYKLPSIQHRTLLTYGTFEAHLAELLEDFEKDLPSHVKLAYLPSAGRVRLRLTAKGDTRKKLTSLLDRLEKEMMERIGEYVYGKNGDTLEQIVGELLRKSGKTLSTAESCTGGMVSHLITTVPGASDYYKGSVISYANEVKIRELGVSEKDVITYGAVSREVVEQMAAGVSTRLKTDYAIAISGIAGPTGGTPEKPVGTVWIAVKSPEKTVTSKFIFGFTRMENITRAAFTSLNMLRKVLMNESFH